MGKRKIDGRLFAIAAILLPFLAVGVTMALMYKKTDDTTNTFTPGVVSCQVNETFDGTKKTSITVTNTGNTSAYIRIKLVSYWKDTAGNVVGRPSELPEVTLDTRTSTECWVQSTSDASVYYYTIPVKSEDETSSLLGAALELKTSTWQDENQKYIIVYQTVDVFAEAVQSEPVNSAGIATAPLEAWGDDFKTAISK